MLGNRLKRLSPLSGKPAHSVVDRKHLPTSCRLLIWASLLASTTTGSAQGRTSAATARQGLKATVLITTVDSKGQPLALGSGFLVRPNVVATNTHVLAGASGASVKLIGSATFVKATGLLATDYRRDLALIAVPLPGVTPLPLASTSVDLGDPIIAIGNPKGLEGTISEGIVSGIREFGPDTLVQITAPISPGSSGGPILSRSGAVVGVAVASLRGGQNLNFAIPATSLRRLTASAGKPAPLGSVPAHADSSMVRQLGGSPVDGISITNIDTTAAGKYIYFSFKNNVDRTIERIRYVVIFYNEANGEPVDSEVKNEYINIRPGLAKRVNFTLATYIGNMRTRKEVRVLDYAFADDRGE